MLQLLYFFKPACSEHQSNYPRRNAAEQGRQKSWIIPTKRRRQKPPPRHYSTTSTIEIVSSFSCSVRPIFHRRPHRWIWRPPSLSRFLEFRVQPTKLPIQREAAVLGEGGESQRERPRSLEEGPTWQHRLPQTCGLPWLLVSWLWPHSSLLQGRKEHTGKLSGSSGYCESIKRESNWHIQSWSHTKKFLLPCFRTRHGPDWIISIR